MRKLWLLLLIVACASPTTLVKDGPVYGYHVKTRNELANALAEGQTWIIIDSPISFSHASEAIDVDALLPQWAGNALTIEAGGDWNSGQLIRLADFPQPLIKFSRSRDWTLQLKGLRFDGWFKCGPALDIGYAQLSKIEKVVIQRFDCAEPFSAGKAGAISATEFHGVELNWNRHPSIIYNASDVRWYGGAIHSNWSGWNSGLAIIAQPHNLPYTAGGPVLVQDIHAEGSDVTIMNVHKVTIERGSYLYSQVYLNGNVGVSFNCNGLFMQNSGIYVNGIRQCFDDL